MEAASAFYADVMGWTVVAPGPDDRTFATAGAPSGGIGELDPSGAPPHWLVDFAVAEAEATG